MIIKRKYSLLVFVLLTCVAILIIFTSYTPNKLAHAEGKKVFSAHADYPILNNVAELSNRADLVVVGKLREQSSKNL